MPDKRRVALLIEMSPTYVRELAHGVAQYNHEHGNWVIHLQRHGPDAPPPKWLKTWKGDGILVRTANPRMARAVVATGLPAVAFRWAIRTPGLPTIGPDNHAVAEMAAAHLRERGFRSFACLGFSAGTYPELDERMSAFGDTIKARGFACELFRAQQNRSEESQQKQIMRWLKSLPKPLGLMACNDACGLWTLNACAWAEINVPDEVAIVGVSNDDCLCALAHPPLSSIDLAPRSIG
ncbi:MAG: XylR family transcriptional regulator, partial [Planctomycetota bacterium]